MQLCGMIDETSERLHNSVISQHHKSVLKIASVGDFPGGPVVQNLPSNAGDTGSISGWGAKIPHAVGQLSPRAATTEPARSGAHAPQLESLQASTKTQCSQINKYFFKKQHPLEQGVYGSFFGISYFTSQSNGCDLTQNSTVYLKDLGSIQY